MITLAGVTKRRQSRSSSSSTKDVTREASERISVRLQPLVGEMADVQFAVDPRCGHGIRNAELRLDDRARRRADVLRHADHLVTRSGEPDADRLDVVCGSSRLGRVTRAPHRLRHACRGSRGTVCSSDSSARTGCQGRRERPRPRRGRADRRGRIHRALRIHPAGLECRAGQAARQRPLPEPPARAAAVSSARRRA